MFAKKKLALRRLALKNFWADNSLVIKLLSSNPLTEDLFDIQAVEIVISQAEHQAKSVALVLGMKSQP